MITFLTFLTIFKLILFILFSPFTTGKPLVGLKNYGETCYANAVFQFLYRNKDFRRSLNEYLRTNQNANMQALQGIFEEMSLAADGATVEPETFKALPPSFVPGVQYDVAEVLAKYQEIPNFDWSPFAIKLQNKDSNIFSIEFDLELLLSVPKKEPVCLHDLLALHFQNSVIQAVSKNLIVRIKRLRTVNGVDEKVLTKISIPQILSLQQFANPATIPASSTQFQLDTFIEHCGTCSDGGHYIFYFHRKKTGEYFAINDDNVHRITREKFLEQASQAYLFLYRQIE